MSAKYIFYRTFHRFDESKRFKKNMLFSFTGLCGILLFSILFSACSNELDETAINGTFIKTYLFDTREMTHNLVVDAKETPDGGILLFGVSGNVENKIDGTGKLYLHKIAVNGTTEWFHFYDETNTGFLANVIEESDGTYTIFWNEAPGELSAVIVDSQLSTPPEIEIKQVDTKDIPLRYITAAKRFTSQNSYLVLGLADFVENNITYKQIYVVELDEEFSLKFKPSGQEYDPSAYGNFGGEDRALMKYLTNYFHLEINDDNIYLAAPYKQNLALKSLGNTKTIFGDRTFWIASMSNKGNRKISALVNNPQQQENGTYYIPEIDLVPNENVNFEYLQESKEMYHLREFDTQKRVILKTLSSGNLIIAGSTQLGQIVIKLFSPDNDLITEKTIGQQIPFELVKVIESADGKSISITGTTKANQEFRRAFLIKIPVSEL